MTSPQWNAESMPTIGILPNPDKLTGWRLQKKHPGQARVF